MTEGIDPFYESDKEENKLREKFEVERDGILNNYKNEDIKIFVYDLFLVFDILNKLNDENISSQLDRDIKKFKKLIDDWAIKYRDIMFELKTTDELSLRVFFKEEKLVDIIKILKDMNRFDRIQKVDEDELTAVFLIGGEENTLTLKQDNKRIRLIYLQEDMVNPKSPEFRLCIYYGLKDGFNKETDLQNYGTIFSFDIEEEYESESWYRRYPTIKFRLWK